MSQPQTSTPNPQAIQAVNAKWVNGVAPGFWPTAGAGLTLNLSAGTSFTGTTRYGYAGGTLSLTDNSTNYVFLDTTASNVPAFNTSGYPTTGIPIATVVTAGGVIATITDDRGPFRYAPPGGDLTGTSVSQQVIGIQGSPINGGPTGGNVLVYNSTTGMWEPTLLPTTPPIQDGLISGGGVSWVGGLNFIVSAALYVISGIEYNSPETSITLATADPTNPRIDVIAVDDTGSVIVLTGTPASNPQAPSIDPATQLALTFVLVPATATIPPGVLDEDIYLEDAGTPTEWTATSSGSGWNLASTNNPYAGTKDIEATAVAKNSFVNFAKGSTITFPNYNQIVFQIRSKATWASARALTIQWYFGGSPVGNSITFKDGTFAFSSSNVTAYQQIVIPTSQFSVPANVDALRMTVSGTGATTIGFYMDNVILQASDIIPPPPVTGITSLNGLTPSAQTMVVGASGTNFNIADAGSVHTFNLPTASATNRGALSSADWTTFNNKGSGSVTSVAMTGDGTVFNSTVSGSPITTTGTLAPALLTQTKNTVLAGPTTGSAANPTFRALVTGDLPASAVISTLTIIIDGGASPPATGPRNAYQLATGYTITGWAAIADQVGSFTLDLCFHAGSAPPAAPSIPNTTTDKISASAPVTLTSAQSSAGGATEISTWATSLTQWGSILPNLVTVSTCQRISVEIYLVRT